MRPQHPSKLPSRCVKALVRCLAGFFLATVIGQAACAGNQVTPQTARPLIVPTAEVTLVWVWDRCLKSTEGLEAIEQVRKRFSSDDRVAVTTVFAGQASPKRIRSIMAKYSDRLAWQVDPNCQLCRQMPAAYWETERASLEAAGLTPEDLATLGSELPSPTVLILDARGRTFAFSGWPLGMDQAQYAASLSGSIEGALVGEFSELTAPHIPWEALSPTELDEALAQARLQLNRWQRMEPAEVEAVIDALRARAKR